MSSLFVRSPTNFRVVAYALEEQAPYALGNMQLSYFLNQCWIFAIYAEQDVVREERSLLATKKLK